MNNLDKLGNEFFGGALVLKPATWGRTPVIELRTVERMDGKSIWLDGSGGSKLQYPGRCIVLTKESFEQLFEIMEKKNE